MSPSPVTPTSTPAATSATSATAAGSAGAPDPVRAPGRRRWWALALLAAAQFLVVLDASIVNIALPVLGTELGLDTAALTWVITAYVLPFGGLLLLGGRLADRYGHRRVFLVGAVGFVLASALAGLSTSGGMLFGARAVQGAAAALMSPAALALVARLFPEPGERSRALGVWGAVAGTGSAAGVLLGGVLTASLGWASVFFVNVPVGIVVAAVAMIVGKDVVADRGRLDLPGAVTVTAGLTALVGALTSAEQLGFAAPLTLSLAAVAVGLGVTFVAVERRAADPLVPFAIFRSSRVRAGNVVMLLVGAAVTALFFTLSVSMQVVLGYDALTAGLTQLPLAGALVVVAGLAPAAIARLGRRNTLTLALAVLAGGLVWLAAAPADAGFAAHLLGPTLLIGAGLGAAFVATTELAVHGVADDEAGLAGGLVNTSQQVGGALGLAALSTLAASRTDSLLGAGASAPEALTSGFAWAYLGAAVLALTGALAAQRIKNGGREARLPA